MSLIILFYNISDWRRPKLVRAFGEYGGIAAGTPGEVTPTKFWGIRGIGMDAGGNIYVAMSEMGSIPTLGGVENTGWIDILTGIMAHKRKDGEYLVFVEEDYKAKSILYRRHP